MCHKVYGQKESLNMHIKNIHETNEIICEHCFISCKSEHIYKKHIKKTHPPTLSPCNKCSEIFNSKEDLEKHINESHKESNVKILWMLDIPEIMVFTAKPLMKEIVDELIDKAVNCVKCDICDKLFAYKQSLSVHMKAFHDNMPKCDICKKSYSSNFNLNSRELLGPAVLIR